MCFVAMWRAHFKEVVVGDGDDGNFMCGVVGGWVSVCVMCVCVCVWGG